MTISIEGRTPTELLRALRGRSPAFVVRHAARLASGPVLRRRISRWAVAVTPGSMPARLGMRDRAALLGHLRGPVFFAWPHQPQANGALRDALLESIPDVAGDARRRADRALRHEVDLLGSGPVELGASIDWLTDFTSGRRWAPGFCRSIQCVDWNDHSDVKVPWELSRGHQLVDLARGFLVTGDERYVDEIGDQLTSWLDANPLGWTVNWACTMDVAIRAVNWIWALSVVAPRMGDDVLVRCAASLWQHGLFIAATLEKSDVNGNHLLSDAAGLVALGAFFRDTRTGQRWLRTGLRILVDETPLQIHPDGVDHEASVPYHRLVCELLLTGFLLAGRAGISVPESCRQRLHAALRFCAAYTRPDGGVPMIGDADDGRLQRFGARRRHDHRHLLSTGAVEFSDGALRAAAGSLHEDTLWLLGPGAAQRFAALAPKVATSPLEVFRDGGFAVLRSQRVHAVMDAGPVGLRGRGGHGHNDALHVDLWLDGPLIVDPGAYVYTADGAARNRFRSSRAHNGPVLDGQEIAEMGDDRHIWFIADQAQAHVVSAVTTADGGSVVGCHQGYSRLGSPRTVTREVRLCGDTLELVDTVDAGEWTLLLTMAPSVRVSLGADSGHGATATLERDGLAPVVVHAAAPGVVLEIAETECSPSYGVRVRCSGLRIHWSGGVLTTRIAGTAARRSEQAPVGALLNEGTE